MPLSWPWITLPCPGQQLFCTDKEMAESVHPPKNCCLKPPDLPLRGLSSCCETALLMPPLSPSCWPGSQEEVALGQRMLWGHLVCPSPAASQKSRRQCTNCASTCSCVNKSSLPFSSQAQVPASWAHHFQLSPAVLGSLGSFQHCIRFTSTPSLMQHPPGRSWAVHQNTEVRITDCDKLLAVCIG